MKNRSMRNGTIDIMRAILIVLIVCDHVSGARGIAGPFDLLEPDSFHVAGFAFISGYMYEEKWNGRPLLYAKYRTIKLLIPTYVTYLIYGILVTFLRKVFIFKIGCDISLQSYLFHTVTSGEQFELNVAMWFCVPFYIAQLLFNLIRSLPNQKYLNKFTYCILAAALIYVGVNVGRWGIVDPEFVLLVSRLSFLLGWIFFGYLFKIGLLPDLKITSLLPIYLIIKLIVAFVGRGFTGYTPSLGLYPLGALLTVFTTISSLLLVYKISNLINSTNNCKIKFYTSILAKNSFSIMNHHILGFFVLNFIFYTLRLSINIFSGFNPAMWKENIWYVYFPHDAPQFGILYVIVGIVFSLLVHYVWDILKHHISKIILNGREALKSI